MVVAYLIEKSQKTSISISLRFFGRIIGSCGANTESPMFNDWGLKRR